MSELFRTPDLPSPDDYTAAAQAFYDELTSGNVTQHSFWRRHMYETESARKFTRVAGTLGLLYEVVDEVSEKPVYPGLHRTAAFTQGAHAGLVISKRIHGGLIRQSELLDSVPSMPVDARLEGLAMRRAYTEELTKYAETGLLHIGESAANTVETIGLEVAAQYEYQDSQLRTIFTRACGLVALTAYGVHREHMEAQQFEDLQFSLVEPATIDWDQALREWS